MNEPATVLQALNDLDRDSTACAAAMMAFNATATAASTPRPPSARPNCAAQNLRTFPASHA